MGNNIQIAISTICKRDKKKKNPKIYGIDFNKAYRMVPHSWVPKKIQMFDVAQNVISLM